jgi:hypothetical protein
MTVHYSPATAGGWLALCSSTSILILGETPTDAKRDELLDALEDPAGLGRALDLLVRDGLAALPPFALLSLGQAGGARVIARGGIVVTAASPVGAESIDGSGVTTWTERVVAGASSLSVSVAGAAPVPGVGSLPLGSGAAWIADLTVHSGGMPPAPASDTPSSKAVPAVAIPVAVAPVAAPVKEPAPVPALPVVQDPETTVVEVPSAEEPEPAPAGGEYDYLFGETMFRGVSEAAVHESEQEPDTSLGDHDGETVLASDLPTPGDHDGETIMTSTIAKLRAGRKRAKRPVTTEEQPAAPKLTLILSDGSRQPLTQPVLVGRAPSISKNSADPLPKLIVIGTADQDISRTHARIALEGGTVVITDLHSRNGTLVALPGKDPQKLRAGEPTSVLVGSVIDFGGGVTITVGEDS